MPAIAIITALLCAEPTPIQLEVLTTFRREFIEITPGKGSFPHAFSMGRAKGGSAAERPTHQVLIKDRFSIAKYEVPQNLWEAVMGSNPSRWPGPRNSVEMISHDDAVEFCRRATGLLRSADLIRANQTVRLPSEAEWEYAARAGSETIYSFGDDPEQLDDYAWHTGNASGNDPPVGAKRPNPWGLYDVHGYLWEWCSDTWHANYQGAPHDASAWDRDKPNSQRVVRGGSWKDRAESLTSSTRRALSPSTKDAAVGLRCVLAEE